MVHSFKARGAYQMACLSFLWPHGKAELVRWPGQGDTLDSVAKDRWASGPHALFPRGLVSVTP